MPTGMRSSRHGAARLLEHDLGVGAREVHAHVDHGHDPPLHGRRASAPSELRRAGTAGPAPSRRRSPARSSRPRSVIAACAQLDRQRHADGGEEGHRGRPAVAEERQRDPGDRHDAHGHAGVLEHAEGDQRERPRGQEAAEGVAGHLGGAQDPPRHHAEKGEHGGRADEPELLAHGREDEVGLLLGHVGQVRLRAVEQARSPEAARADGGHRLVEVVGAALRLGVLVQERR